MLHSGTTFLFNRSFITFKWWFSNTG